MSLTILCGDALEQLRTLPDESVQCCVTSPPYWGLRDYGVREQIGLEKTPEEYVAKIVAVFREVRRVLKNDGTLWLNLGDSYAGSWGNYHPDSPAGKHGQRLKETARWNRRAYSSQEFLPPTASCGSRIGSKHGDSGHTSGHPPPPGLKAKDLVGIPWMVAFALRADGWYLRQDIIWHKPNPMPESVTDRCTKSHEYLFLLTKSARYFYDAEAIFEVATGYDGRKDTLLKPSTKYSSRNIRADGGLNTCEVKGQERWCKLPDNYKGSLPGRSGGPGQDRRSTNGREPRKHDGTYHGSNGSGFQDHSGYSNLDNPYVRNKRSVWTVNSQPYRDAHFATYPPDLIKPCILAGCPVGGTVLDPFAGSGTTGMVALELARKALLIELNPEYVKLIEQRCNVTPGLALV